MSNRSSQYILPTCAIVSSCLGVASIQFSLGLFFEALGPTEAIFPGMVQLSVGIHQYRWVILVLGTMGLLATCWKVRTEGRQQLVCGLYMLFWFILCFSVQFFLIYGLNVMRSARL